MSVAKRIELLRNRMRAEEIDCCLIFTSDWHQSEAIKDYFKTREFFSGFTGSAGSLLVTLDKACLFTDGRYFIQAEKELAGSGITLHRVGAPGVKGLFEVLKELVVNFKESTLDKHKNEQYEYVIGTDLSVISMKNFSKITELSDYCVIAVKEFDAADDIWTQRPKLEFEAVRLPDTAYTGCDSKIKRDIIRNKLHEMSADALLVSELSDVCWTFNIRGNDIAYNQVAFSYGIITTDKDYLFLNRNVLNEQDEAKLSEENVIVVPYDEFENFICNIVDKTIICDNNYTNARIYSILNENNTIKNVLSYKLIGKHIKNEIEQINSKHIHEIDGLCLTRFIYRIKKIVKEGNISEYEAATLLDEMRLNNEACLGLSFETISAYGENAALVHYSAKKAFSATLKPEGFLLVDSGGQYEGVTTDVTRTIALGKLTDEMINLYTAVLKGMLDLADACFVSGATGENLDVLARQYLWNLQLDYRHGTGHGIGAGLNVHEAPCRIGMKSVANESVALEQGMVISDEPGVYLENKFGIRIENQLLCVKKGNSEYGDFLGFDTLTLVPFERDAIDVSKLDIRHIKILNAYNLKLRETYLPLLSNEEANWLCEVTQPFE